MSFVHNAAVRKRFRIGFGLLLLAVFGGIAWLTLRPSEPMYEGKTLSVWLEEYVHSSPNSELSNNAKDALHHIGTNAIPTLLCRLKRDFT